MLACRIVKDQRAPACIRSLVLWLRCSALLLALFIGWTLRLAPAHGDAALQRHAPNLGVERTRADELTLQKRQTVSPAPKLERRASPKRNIEDATPLIAAWHDRPRSVRAEASFAPLRTGEISALIRRRIPRLGSEEPPWNALNT